MEESSSILVVREPKVVKDPFLVRIFYAYTLKRLSSSQKSCMKEFVEAIRGENLYHTGSLHKVTGGQRCRKTHWTMQRSVISVKGSP